MTNKIRKVVDVTCSNVFHSVPTTPITKHSKSFFDKTTIPKTDAPQWKTGIPHLLHDESLSPNQGALSLLADSLLVMLEWKGM